MGFTPGQSILSREALPDITMLNIQMAGGAILLGLFAILGLLAALIAAESTPDPWRSSPSSYGEVVSCTEERNRARLGDGGNARVSYQYAIGNAIFHGVDTHYGSDCSGYFNGRRVVVYYKRDNVRDSRLAAAVAEDRGSAGLVGFVIVFAAGVGLFQLFQFGEYVAAYRRTAAKFDALQRATTILDGVIYRAGYGGWFSDWYRRRATWRRGPILDHKRTTIAVGFRFRSPSGKELYGKQVIPWPDSRELPQRGTPVKILYADDSAYLAL